MYQINIMLNYKTLSIDVLKELSRFHSGYSLECISQSISKYAEIDERKDDKFAETARANTTTIAYLICNGRLGFVTFAKRDKKSRPSSSS